MSHKNKSTYHFLKASTSAVLDQDTRTATFQSQAYNLSDSEWFGLYLKLENISGTSPTLDVNVQFSPDGGTTWSSIYPDGENSETNAALAQVTGSSDVEVMRYWRNIVPLQATGSGLNPQIRFNFTFGGTSPSYDITAHLFWSERKA